MIKRSSEYSIYKSIGEIEDRSWRKKKNGWMIKIQKARYEDVGFSMVLLKSFVYESGTSEIGMQQKGCEKFYKTLQDKIRGLILQEHRYPVLRRSSWSKWVCSPNAWRLRNSRKKWKCQVGRERPEDIAVRTKRMEI